MPFPLMVGESVGSACRRRDSESRGSYEAHRNATHEMPSVAEAAAAPGEAFAGDEMLVIDGRRVVHAELPAAQAAYAPHTEIR